DVVHRPVVIIADPDADDQGFIEADEPGIPMVLGGSGLAGGKAGQLRGAAGAVADDALEEREKRFLIGVERALRRIGRSGWSEVRLALAPVAGDAPGPDRHRSPCNRGVGGGEVKQAHLGSTQRNAGIAAERGGDAKIMRSRDYLVDADLVREPRRG